MELKVKILSEMADKKFPCPQYATQGSAAMDLIACIADPVVIHPGERKSISNGIAIEIPSPDYVALLFARSGLATKFGICLANGVGVIDSDYRGPLSTVLFNASDKEYVVMPGDRVSQLMIVPIFQASVNIVSELSDTTRGTGGFGSTGK